MTLLAKYLHFLPMLLLSTVNAQSISNEVTGGSSNDTDADDYGVSNYTATIEAMRQKLMILRPSKDAVLTTIATDGQAILWTKQVSKVAAVPSLSSNMTISTPNATDDIVISASSFERLFGPKGTVPTHDFGVTINNMLDEELLGSEVLLGTTNFPRPLLSKTDKSERDQPHRQLQFIDTYKIKYAVARQVVINYGSEGFINIWKPSVQSRDPITGRQNDELSTAHVAILGGSTTTQAIYCGWHVYPLRYGDSSPHFYTYFTTNGFASHGNNIGGYNRDVSGFVQYSSTIFPGRKMPEALISSIGAHQHSMHAVIRLYRGNWWIQAFGEWIGYYPATLFSQQGLRYGSTSVEWVGAVADRVDDVPTRTWMGSGRYAAYGFRYAAYMRNIVVYRLSCNCVEDFVPDPCHVTNTYCYSCIIYNSGPRRSHFYYGGPGGSNPYCTE